MDAGMISARYAKALLACAKERGDDRRLFDLMSQVVDSFEQCPELTAVLKNPTLSVERKKSLALAAAGNTDDELYARMVDLLLENGREEALQRIALDYCDLFQVDTKVCVGRVTTAKPIDKASCQRIIQMLEKRSGRQVELKTRVNPDLLGGFVLDVEGERLDASVAGQLLRIKKKLAQ